MELIQSSTYGTLLFAATIKVYILKASPVVNRFFLTFFAQPHKITGFSGKDFPIDLSTGWMLKVGFNRGVRIDHIIIHRGS